MELFAKHRQLVLDTVCTGRWRGLRISGAKLGGLAIYDAERGQSLEHARGLLLQSQEGSKEDVSMRA